MNQKLKTSSCCGRTRFIRKFLCRTLICLSITTGLFVTGLFTTQANAETTESAQSLPAETVQSAPTAPGALTNDEIAKAVVAETFRTWTILGHYSQIDLILPAKMGLAIGRRDSERSMWEFEFTHGRFTPFFIEDIGTFTEDRYTIKRRMTGEDGAGFQWFYGLFYQKFDLSIGNALLSRLTGGSYPSVDLISIGGIGTTIGVGYRWIFKKNFLLGVEALAWSQPLFTTSKDTKFLDIVSNQNDRDNANTAVRVMQYFPRVTVAKIELGCTF